MVIPALDPIHANFQQASGAFVATSKLGEVREDHDHHIANVGAPGLLAHGLRARS